MISVKNISVDVTVRSKKITTNNTLTDSFLDWVISKNFSESVIANVFSDFERTAEQPYMDKCYLAYDNTQSLDETSSTMIYDDSATSISSSFAVEGNTVRVSKRYVIDITGVSNVQLTQIGFGIDDSFTKWLFSFLEMSDLGLFVSDGYEVVIDREDLLSTDLESITMDDFSYLYDGTKKYELFIVANKYYFDGDKFVYKDQFNDYVFKVSKSDTGEVLLNLYKEIFDATERLIYIDDNTQKYPMHVLYPYEGTYPKLGTEQHEYMLICIDGQYARKTFEETSGKSGEAVTETIKVQRSI